MGIELSSAACRMAWSGVIQIASLALRVLPREVVVGKILKSHAKNALPRSPGTADPGVGRYARLHGSIAEAVISEVL